MWEPRARSEVLQVLRLLTGSSAGQRRRSPTAAAAGVGTPHLRGDLRARERSGLDRCELFRRGSTKNASGATALAPPGRACGVTTTAAATARSTDRAHEASSPDGVLPYLATVAVNGRETLSPADRTVTVPRILPPALAGSAQRHVARPPVTLEPLAERGLPPSVARHVTDGSVGRVRSLRANVTNTLRGRPARGVSGFMPKLLTTRRGRVILTSNVYTPCPGSGAASKREFLSSSSPSGVRTRPVSERTMN